MVYWAHVLIFPPYILSPLVGASIVYHCIGLLVTCCLRSWYLLLYRDLVVLLEAQVAVETREIGETEDLADLLDHPEMTESP